MRRCTRSGGRDGEVTAPRRGAEAVVGHEAPRPGPVVELDDEHGAGVAQRVDGALAPQLEVAPEPLAVVVGLDRLEPVVENVEQDQHAPAPRLRHFQVHDKTGPGNRKVTVWPWFVAGVRRRERAGSARSTRTGA